MSRSIRKTKIFGNATNVSEKQDRRRHNSTLRKVFNELIRLEKKIQGVTDVWDGAKDGKKYYRGATKKDMRK